MRLVTGARYDALQGRYRQVVDDHDAIAKLAEDRLHTIVRLSQEIDELRDKTPNSPLQQPRLPQGDAELRRQLHLAHRAITSLDGRLADLQTANESQAKQLREHADSQNEKEGSAS
jgi:hypothetical protein